MSSPATILLAERARWFRALASPSRLRILELLRESDLCACDIQMELNLPRAELQEHLALLETAQLILSTHDGNWRYYSIVAENLRHLSEYLETLGEPLLLPAPYCGSPDPSGRGDSPDLNRDASNRDDMNQDASDQDAPNQENPAAVHHSDATQSQEILLNDLRR